MDPITTASIISGGAALAGGAAPLFGRGTQRKHEIDMANRAFDRNMQMAEYAYGKELEQWHRQNRYNSPEMQMKRLKEAGINPHMAYGKGSMTNTSSGNLPKYQAPKVDYSQVSGPLNMSHAMSAVGGAISKYQDIALKQAQVDNVRANAWATEENAVVNWINSIPTQYDTGLMRPPKKGEMIVHKRRGPRSRYGKQTMRPHYIEESPLFDYQAASRAEELRKKKSDVARSDQSTKESLAKTILLETQNDWYPYMRINDMVRTVGGMIGVRDLTKLGRSVQKDMKPSRKTGGKQTKPSSYGKEFPKSPLYDMHGNYNPKW